MLLAVEFAERAYSLAPWNTATTGLFAGALMRAGDKRGAQELLAEPSPVQYGTPAGLLVYHMACR